MATAQYPTARLPHGRLAAKLTAQLASYPTLCYVVVTAVRRTKHLDAKLLHVSNNNEQLAGHDATLRKTRLAHRTYLGQACSYH